MTGPLVISGTVGAVTVAPGTWWRVYANVYAPHAYNPSDKGNARFSPIADSSGAVIPTLYLGATESVALMETVLHDCPVPSSGFILTLPKASQERRRLASLEIQQPLLLADFSAMGLKRMGLRRSAVVDSDKTHYPQTRDLAQQVLALRPDVQGIQWTSRQDDRAASLVLFGSRIDPAALVARAQGLPINQGVGLDALVGLPEKRDAGLVLG